MTTIRIDGIEYELPRELEGQNLLHVALSLGLDLPYFCWHPAMDSVGACRQCAVTRVSEDEDEPDQIVMACMTGAEDGSAFRIESPEARDFRARVIEWLMVNHPHDCPVCDEGGECHLQDMTVMTGHNYRRFRFEKRTHENQYLGPFINHEMNRCIACYRCVRFYQDYAGGRDLQALGAHHNVYFGRHADGVLESEFSGNLVEVCPTGVFTDKTLKQHYTRKWDLQSAPSVCVHCGVGCNTLAGERYGGVRRILNRYHHEVNGYFLCDRGRFGYEFANRDDRVTGPLVRKDGKPEPAAPEELDELLAGLAASAAGGNVWGVGSPRASLEANYALKSLVGEERFSTGMAAPEQALAERAVELVSEIGTPSLEKVRRSDAVLVLGEDPSDTAPVLALALRRAAREGAKHLLEGKQVREWDDGAAQVALQGRTGPFYLATPTATRLDDVATESVRLGPEGVAELGRAVAAALAGKGRETRKDSSGAGSGDDLEHLAGEIAEALAGASRPVVVTGIACGSREVLEAAAEVAEALAGLAGRGGRSASDGEDDEPERDPSGLVVSFPECDTVGVTLLGGRPVDDVFESVLDGNGPGTLLVLENDLFRRAPGDRVEALFDAVRSGGGRVVVLDHLLHGTARAGDLVLPAATFAEGDGTYVSSEGRAQRAFQVYVPEGDLPADAPIEESWRWLARIAASAAEGGSDELRAGLPWRSLDQVVAAVAASDPVFAPLPEVAPDEGFRAAGQKVPREPARASGRTAENAGRSVHEPKPPADPDAALVYSMEGTRRQPPPALTPFYWAPGWNSVQSLNRFQQEVGGPLRGGDPGRRLLEPDGPKPRVRASDRNKPAPGAAGDGALVVVPLHHVFGSDELSARAPAVAELTPAGYLALHPEDAAAGRLEEGSQATLELPDGPVTLPLRLREDLPRGVAGLPVGLPGVPYRALPARARVAAAVREEEAP